MSWPATSRAAGQDRRRCAVGLVAPITQNRYNTLSSAYSILALEAYAQVAEAQPAAGFAIAEVAANGQQKALALPAGLFPVTNFSPEVGRLLISASGPAARLLPGDAVRL